MNQEQNINRKIESVREDIDKKFNRNNYFNRNISSHFYEEIIDVEDSKFKSRSEVQNETFLTNNYKFLKALIYISIFWIVLIINDHKKIAEPKTNPFEFWLFVVLTFLVLYMTYYSAFKKKKKFLETTEEYLIINSKKKVDWKDILITGTLTINYRYGREKRVILGTMNEIIIINRENSNLSTSDIIQIINLNKNAV